MRAKRVYASERDVSVERRGFGLIDTKGRELGGSVRLSTADYVAAEDQGWPDLEPGTYYEAEPHATRAGRSFGALQREHRFTTLEARAAYVEKYFREAAKRAAKVPGVRPARSS